MIGVAVNAIGIVAGGVSGLVRKAQLTTANESFFKVAMGAAAVFLGLQLTWQSFNGSFGARIKQFVIVMIAMSLGKIVGRLLRFQRISNAIGRHASNKLSQPADEKQNQGFLVAALLSCANPLSVFASVQEGLSPTGFAPIFVVKALMDGLAAMTFVRVFGGSVMASAIPVIAFQGTIIVITKSLLPFLQQHGLIDSILATDGLLIFCVSLIILNLKKIALADYIPSLAIAPAITWIWK